LNVNSGDQLRNNYSYSNNEDDSGASMKNRLDMRSLTLSETLQLSRAGLGKDDGLQQGKFRLKFARKPCGRTESKIAIKNRVQSLREMNG